ncbi:MAG: hypoxanthine phosphoribosyltransferase [Bacteroidales bacterium]
MNTIKIYDKTFEVFIGEKEILDKVKQMAAQIEKEHRGKDVLFISILNGSFVFTADLLRDINMDVKLSFLKLSSYDGDRSSGSVRRLIGLNEDLAGKSVIIVEDIIDTGRTLDGIIDDLQDKGPDEIKVASLLIKPDAYTGSHRIDYTGFEIPNDFVIGYGLDFDGLGRNLRSVYRVVKDGNG